MALITKVIVCLAISIVAAKDATTKPPVEKNNSQSYTTVDDANVTTEVAITTVDSTCDANSSLCIVDNTTSLTETPLNVYNFYKPNFEDSTKNYKAGSTPICSCDYQLRFCDINCCCDKDCSNEDRLLFKTCNDAKEEEKDSRLCKYVPNIYKNNSQYEWDLTHNNLFCIVKSNLPPQYIATPKQSVKSESEIREIKKHQYGWKQYEHKDFKEKIFNMNNTFKYGEPIWMLKNQTDIFALEFPNKVVNNVCNIKTHLEFLKNYGTKCSQIILNEDNEYLNLKTYFNNLTVISLPQLWASNLTTFLDCPKNICVPINASICNNNFHTCENLNGNISRLEPTCRISYSNGIKNCRNFVKNIQYYIYHNGTEGIKNVTLQIYLQDINIDIRKEYYEFEQEFQIKYLWHNYTLNYSDFTSGNTGYISGKPILIADLHIIKNVSTNTTSNETTISFTEKFERYHGDFRTNFMVLPKNVNGLCYLTNYTYLPIEFEYNLITKCMIKRSFKLPSKNVTALKMCAVVHSIVLEYWSIQTETINNTVVNKTVGNWGNSNINTKENWNSIIFENSPQTIINSTSGQFRNNNKILRCHNISTTFKVDFFHAREEYKSIQNQAKIVGTFITLESFQSFDHVIINNTVFIDIPIRSEVMFYDISMKQVSKYVDPPSFELKLPSDFFYPFMKIDNAAEGLTINFYVLFALIVLII